MSLTDKYETKWFPCECTEHAISVSEWIGADDDNIYFSLWGNYNGRGDSWRERIRAAWGALRGNMFLDNVILSQHQVADLSTVLWKMQKD